MVAELAETNGDLPLPNLPSSGQALPQDGGA